MGDDPDSSPGQAPPSARTEVRRGAHRAAYDLATVHAIIDAAPLCHAGVVAASGPLVVPMAHGRVDDMLYLHGAPANATLRAALEGGLCATFTCLDGLVVARTPLHNSMNYRCAVVFGRPRRVEGGEKRRAARAVSEHVLGAWEHGRPPTGAEMDRTLVVGLEIAEASAKVRTGDPVDEPEDVEGPWWAGTVPLEQVWGSPVPAGDLPPGIAVPAHLVPDPGRTGARR